MNVYKCTQHGTAEMSESEAQMHYMVIQHHTASEYIAEDQAEEEED